MRIIVALFLLQAPIVSGASAISVGGTNLEIPAPVGYAVVTPEMKDLYEAQKLFVSPDNEEFITFIPEETVSAVLQGGVPELPRRFSVQTAKAIVGASASSSDFAKLKAVIKTQNDEIFAKVKQQVPDILNQVNAGISKNYDLDLALSVSQIIPLQIHEETDRSLAYSSVIKYSANDGSGNPVSFVGTNTTTFVHINGKVIFLYSFADEKDLEWSRKMSSQWASAVLAANPGSFRSSVRESLPSVVSGIDWGRVGSKAIVGAFLGLIIGLISWVINRRKARS